MPGQLHDGLAEVPSPHFSKRSGTASDASTALVPLPRLRKAQKRLERMHAALVDANTRAGSFQDEASVLKVGPSLVRGGLQAMGHHIHICNYTG